MTLYFAALLALFQTTTPVSPRLERTVPFDQPLNIVATCWVLLDVEIDPNGRVRTVQPLYGFSPFSDIAVANVSQWVFASSAPSATNNPHATVVFLFRSRELFSASPTPVQVLNDSVNRTPIPSVLSDPGYPVTSVGEGSTILQADVTAAGAIQQVRIVSDGPGLAAHTEMALRSWTFHPAIRNGAAVSGNVIVVASYLRPVINDASQTRGQTSNTNENPGPPAPAVFRGGGPEPPRF
jgi:hypothetical protein